MYVMVFLPSLEIARAHLWGTGHGLFHPDLSSVNNFMMWRSNKPAATARDGVQDGG
jgi:hypothetical protein